MNYINKNFILSLSILVLILLFFSCGTKDEMFIVVQENEYGIVEPRAFGKINIKAGQPDLWKPGQLVLFRCDADYHGFSGKKGFAYRINDDLKLSKIGTFDLVSSSNKCNC